MKLLVLLAALVACVHARKLANAKEQFIPTFHNGRMTNGHDARPHSAPYIVSVAIAPDYIHDCGGTIIAKDWILTAAHCIDTFKDLSIVAGLHERSRFDNKTQIRSVDWIKVHENYAGGPTPNDIALLHLSEPLEYNQYVQPAALPALKEIHSGETHLYGWGQFEAFVYSRANVLQAAETEILEFNACKEALPDNVLIAETNMCSSSMKMNISACSGDSGGPLVIEHKGAPAEVIGVVSWGFVPCGLNNQPSVYVRVSAYIDWIVKIQNAYYVLF